MRGSPHCKSYSYADRSTLYIHVTRVCRTRSASRLSRPGAGYPRSEGAGAKFKVYLGIYGYSCQSPKSRTGRYTDATPSPFSPCLCGVPCSSLEVGS